MATTTKNLTPFDFINDISLSKQDLLKQDESNEKAYNPFMVNRGFSLYPDTIIIANEVNKIHQLDKKLQYYFLLNTIRPMKRWSKWPKKVNDDELEMVKEYYGFSIDKAEAALKILTQEQKNAIEETISKGGK